MPSKRFRHHENRCWHSNKLSSPSEHAAQAFLRRSYQKGRRWASTMRVYACPHCTHWHTTSQRPAPLAGPRS